MSEKQAEYNAEENIFRVQKTERYFVASNIPFNDERLTWEARGVMGYLLSKPANWQTRMNDLVHKGPAKMTVIRRILAELRKYGYMNRKRIRVAQGKWAWETTLYESPELNKEYQETICRFTIDGSAIDGKPIDVLSTDLRFYDDKGSQTTTPPARFSEQEAQANYGLLVTLYYENLSGIIVPMLNEKIKDVSRLYPPELYAPAFEAAVMQNARNWAYVQKCIENAAAGKEPPKRTPYTPRAPKETRKAVLPVTHDAHGIPESW